MFGISNQLLAVVALLIGTTIIINLGRARYVWVTVIPLIFLSTTTLTAGYLSVKDIFWPMAVGANPAVHFQGYLDSVLTVIMMSCVVVILFASVRRWIAVGKSPAPSSIASPRSAR
jgi:carbon starvation protein